MQPIIYDILLIVTRCSCNVFHILPQIMSLFGNKIKKNTQKYNSNKSSKTSRYKLVKPMM